TAVRTVPQVNIPAERGTLRQVMDTYASVKGHPESNRLFIVDGAVVVVTGQCKGTCLRFESPYASGRCAVAFIGISRNHRGVYQTSTVFVEPHSLILNGNFHVSAVNIVAAVFLPCIKPGGIHRLALSC